MTEQESFVILLSRITVAVKITLCCCLTYNKIENRGRVTEVLVPPAAFHTLVFVFFYFMLHLHSVLFFFFKLYHYFFSYINSIIQKSFSLTVITTHIVWVIDEIAEKLLETSGSYSFF